MGKNIEGDQQIFRGEMKALEKRCNSKNVVQCFQRPYFLLHLMAEPNYLLQIFC